MLGDYSDRVVARCRDAARDLPGPTEQQALLSASLDRMAAHVGASPGSNPLVLLGGVAAAWGRALDAQAEEVGAFVLFYVAALDLFDDVQDGDLEGGPYEDAGEAIAINTALTLLQLGERSLLRAMEEEPTVARALAWQELYNRTLGVAVAAQHRDLRGSRAIRSPAEVIENHGGKTSSIAMTLECGAMLSPEGRERLALYGTIGRDLAILAQIVDDLRDVLAKEHSSDLRAGTMTYPVACYLERAGVEDAARFEALLREPDASLPALRSLLYEGGAVEACAEEIERRRVRIHEALASTGNPHGAHRMLLETVDALADAIYVPEAVDASAFIRLPVHGAHAQVREHAQRVAGRLDAFGYGELPELRPWISSAYAYVPDRQVIYYPDVEDFSREVLGLQAELLGVDNDAALRAAVLHQLPAVLAHELFHALRHRTGRMTDDVWHEEHAANALAVAYAREHAPEALASALELADTAIARHGAEVADKAAPVLADAPRYTRPRGYEMDAREIAVTQLMMVRQLAQGDERLGDAVERWLRPSP